MFGSYPIHTPIQILYVLADELSPEERSKSLPALELIKLRREDNSIYNTVAEDPKVKSSYNRVSTCNVHSPNMGDLFPVLI